MRVMVLCKWNTLLIVLEVLGLSRQCRQKCDGGHVPAITPMLAFTSLAFTRWCLN